MLTYTRDEFLRNEENAKRGRSALSKLKALVLALSFAGSLMMTTKAEAAASCAASGCYVDAVLGPVCNMNPGQTMTFPGSATYGGSFPASLPALGLGETFGPTNVPLGYIQGGTPLTCYPTGGSRAIGTGNSSGAPGKICEINFDPTNPGVGTATYAVTVDPAATFGTQIKMGLNCNRGSGTQTCTWSQPNFIINICGGVPVITSPLTGVGTAGVMYSYQITATNNPTSFNATNLPAGVTISTTTGLMMGTPTGPAQGPIHLTATNAAGSGTQDLALTITGPCGTGKICGTITALENGQILPAIKVILRNAQTGQMIRDADSDASGNYVFSGLTDAKYYVDPATERSQNSSGSQMVYTTFSYNVKVRGVPASVQFTNLEVGTFILLTPSAAYTGVNPPTIQAGNGLMTISTEVGQDGLATLNIPFGDWYYTCWVPHNSMSDHPSWDRTPSTGGDHIATPLIPNGAVVVAGGC